MIEKEAAGRFLDEAAPQPPSTERKFAAALRLSSLPHQTWGSLDGIYQLMKSDFLPKGWRALTALGVSESELKAFRRALHIGTRYGIVARFLKRSPMTLEEAEALVRRMLHAWTRTTFLKPMNGAPPYEEGQPSASGGPSATSPSPLPGAPPTIPPNLE